MYSSARRLHMLITSHTKTVEDVNTIEVELRTKIYEYILVVKVPINPFPAAFEIITEEYQQSKAQYPSPALLAVNKQISSEAGLVLYTKNCWRFNAVIADQKLRNFLGHKTWKTCAGLLLRNVNMVLDYRDVSDEQKHALYRGTHATSEEEWSANNVAAAKARHVHTQSIFLAEDIYIRNAARVQMFRNLQTLTIDLSHFWCPSGCCRLKLMAETSEIFRSYWARRFTSPWIRESELSKLFVTGLLNEDERKAMHSYHGYEEPKDEYKKDKAEHDEEHDGEVKGSEEET